MIDDILSLQRRGFLQQTAGVMALAAVTAGSEAAVFPARPKVLALYQQHDATSVAFAAALQQHGIAVQALGTDVVRFWRQQLRDQVVREQVRLVGLTAFADFFVLKGLAAEERIFPVFAARPPQTQTNSAEGLQQQVQAVLATLDQSAFTTATAISASPEPAMFSWII